MTPEHPVRLGRRIRRLTARDLGIDVGTPDEQNEDKAQHIASLSSMLKETPWQVDRDLGSQWLAGELYARGARAPHGHDHPEQDHCGHIDTPCGCENSPDPDQLYDAMRSQRDEARATLQRVRDAALEGGQNNSIRLRRVWAILDGEALMLADRIQKAAEQAKERRK